MALTIDASVGGAAANSYATEAEVIAYMATRLNASAWTTLSGSSCTETEKAAMIEAQRELSVLQWAGTQASSTQALQWPRYWVSNPDDPWKYYYLSTVVPTRVKNAQAELAFQFLKAGTTDVAAVPSTQGIIQKTIDVLTTIYSEFNQPTGLARFPRVLNLVRPLLQGSGNTATVLRG